ncbi:conserved hypothetical protein [Cellulomonas flavigena DSM 20109]|uniref:Glyoxalase-like domain-containing protein n=1 Tax=Cellulomonas flavigena (strain ATCC 482 / DSM 20109 / BCRC 11376 / JCM 18109 / NBRC 3775 / NCIMB 8073 / NRS 134) TaxID=446466 RepID=D5UBT6_CELFN|nr:VOC family protein [Cellulomonas flavigena]ADG74181.1 conserved hypothetical protein [Cellulomonas flavigena DSM 20109]
MSVVWNTAFLDLPADVHARGTAFWCAVTATTPSEPRGEDAQFATLLPGDGDAFLRVQRLGDVPRVHVDLHVEDVDAEASRAVGLGARVLLREEHVVLVSPGGFVHCLVPDEGERARPAPVMGARGGTARLDQVCLDVPAGLLTGELAYWTALTGWSARQVDPEFHVLERPAGMPLRLLAQTLGTDDDRDRVSAHLDLAAGNEVATVVAEHVDLGAEVLDVREEWTVLRGPAGVVYCVTRRDPRAD